MDLGLFYIYNCYRFSWVGGNWNCPIYTVVTTSTVTALSFPLLPLHLGRREMELSYIYHCDQLTCMGGNWNCFIYKIVTASVGYEGTGTVLYIPL